MLRALAYRNYRLFFGGQVVSLVGTWITMTATNWLVYRLTGSALLLGVVGFAGQFPAFVLGPFAGIFVDRWDRHRLLVVTQTISMLQSFALAALVLSGHITLDWIIALSIVQGLVNAFDMPARQAFLLTMIENRADLGNAIALNSSMVNLARLIGPSIAGVVIAATNEGWCFLIDGVSYVAVIVALLRMRYRAPRRPVAARRRAAAVPRRILLRVRVPSHPLDHPAPRAREPRRRAVLGADAGICDDVFHGGPYTLGFLMTVVRLRRAPWCAVAGAAPIGRRPGPRDPDGQRAVRRRADLFLVHARALARDSVPRRRRLRVHGADGLEQHRHPDDRGRRKTRPRDELLHDGVPRHGAVRQPDRRLAVARIGAAHTLLVGGSAASSARCGLPAPSRRFARPCVPSTSGLAFCRK